MDRIEKGKKIVAGRQADRIQICSYSGDNEEATMGWTCIWAKTQELIVEF
jgi:hypothetical protein